MIPNVIDCTKFNKNSVAMNDRVLDKLVLRLLECLGFDMSNTFKLGDKKSGLIFVNCYYNESELKIFMHRPRSNFEFNA